MRGPAACTSASTGRRPKPAPWSFSRRADGFRALVTLTPGSNESAQSSADLMRECADRACAPCPGGRWHRPGLYDGTTQVFPSPARAAVCGSPNGRRPRLSFSSEVRAARRSRSRISARRVSRPGRDAGRDVRPALRREVPARPLRRTTGEETEPPVPGPAAYGIELGQRRVSPARPLALTTRKKPNKRCE
jgi:hypothetical protein